MASELLTAIMNRVTPPQKAENSGIEVTDCPQDYLEFLAAFGAGDFSTAQDGFPELSVMDLSLPESRMRDGVKRGIASMHEANPLKFPNLSPSVNGVIPWGRWEEGFLLCWRPTGAMSDWQVCIIAPREGLVVDCRCNMLQYIANALGLSIEQKIDLSFGPSFSADEEVRFFPRRI